MEHLSLVNLGLVPVLGILSAWLAWRLNLPSILILLITGILFGPILGVLHTDAVFGDLLLPIISISVAIIMFEGGLSLKFSDIKNFKNVVWRLVTLGDIVTWTIIALACFYVLGLNVRISILLGSILTLTGPTVVIPLLRHVRPKKALASILRWEGILIDPVVAIQSLLLLDIVVASNLEKAVSVAAIMIFKTITVGTFLGVLGAWGLIWIIYKHWAPEYLQEAVTFITVIGIYVVSDVIQPESGLYSVTIMGIILANQKKVSIQHIISFKEHIALILLASMFVMLASRLSVADLVGILTFRSLIFVLILTFLARPITVFLCSIGSNLSLKEKLFLSWMAPRGLVAAAVASLFAIRLEAYQVPQSDALVPITFLVIISTVLLYSLTSKWVAVWLRLVHPKYQGVLFVGAHNWARQLAKILFNSGVSVLLVSTNKRHIRAAEADGLPSILASVLSKDLIDATEFMEVGKLLAITPNEEINYVALEEYSSVFGHRSVYALPASHLSGEADVRLKSKVLFGDDVTFNEITSRISNGCEFKTFKLTQRFNLEKFRKEFPEGIPLFVLTDDGKVFVFSSDNSNVITRPGSTLVALV